MRRSRRGAFIVTSNPPLEERVDRAGIRQRENPLEARESRQLGRKDSDPAGWWYHDGAGDWEFYGEAEE